LITFFLGFLLSAAAIYWALHQTNLSAVWDRIREAGALSWFPAALLYVVNFIPRGWRSRLMLLPVKDIRFRQATESVIVGYSANNLLPFRMGEVIRAYSLSSATNLSTATCLASVLAERILDALSLIVFLGICLLFAYFQAGDITHGTMLNSIFLVAGAFLLLSAFGIAILVLWSEHLVRLGKKFLGPKVGGILDNMLQATSFLNRPRLLGRVLALSMLIWLIEGMMFVFLALTMHISSPLLVGYFALVVINFGILIPSTPGYVGTFEACSILTFMTLGLDNASGLAFGILSHSAQFLPLTALGIAIGLKMGLPALAALRMVPKSAI
jgi:hypothetical protein